MGEMLIKDVVTTNKEVCVREYRKQAAKIADMTQKQAAKAQRRALRRVDRAIGELRRGLPVVIDSRRANRLRR